MSINSEKSSDPGSPMKQKEAKAGGGLSVTKVVSLGTNVLA